MTDEEKKAIQEWAERECPEEMARAKLPFYYHEGRRALIIKPYAIREGVQYAEENGITSIELSGTIDLSPLKDSKSIRYLGLNGNFQNVDAIYDLPLKAMSIDNEHNKAQIDISRFTMLNRLILTKNRKNIVGLSRCTSLQELWLYDYKVSERNLAEISSLVNLHTLDLTYAKIDSLDGIEKLTCLKKLSIYYSRSLKSIKALEGNDISQSLKYLEIDHCQNIDTYTPIENLKNLEILLIEGCKTIDTRRFIKSLNESAHVYISPKTKILDEMD